jgi:hypothetical protein
MVIGYLINEYKRRKLVHMKKSTGVNCLWFTSQMIQSRSRVYSKMMMVFLSFLLYFFPLVFSLFVLSTLIPYPNHDDESLLISHESDYDTGSNQFS